MAFIAIHGTKGSPQGNWFPWIREKLESAGQNVHVPSMPTPDGQNLQNWLAVFKTVPVNRHAVLIGHSMGAGFILRALENLHHPVRAAILIAPFMAKLDLPEYDQLNRTFTGGPVNWPKIRSNCAQFICIAGADDPYVGLEKSRFVADQLNAPLEIIAGGGHLNAEFGYTEFPRLWEICQDLIENRNAA